jgi:hypothetical protein
MPIRSTAKPYTNALLCSAKKRKNLLHSLHQQRAEIDSAIASLERLHQLQRKRLSGFIHDDLARLFADSARAKRIGPGELAWIGTPRKSAGIARTSEAPRDFRQRILA